jgi:serine/threonine protein kinase
LLVPQGPDLIGRTIGEYEIVRKLGIGGMGIVYEGRHPVIGKRVAVKVLLSTVSGEKEVFERFLSEARAVNEIRHRGIVDIFSFGQLPEGNHYFVMEYLEGEPFDVIVKNRAPLPIGEVLQWAEEVLDALDSAHEAGVIHRDIKPSNLFLVNTGRGRPYVKLLDFGISKVSPPGSGESSPQTRASVIMGTPDYISPEQARGRPISNRTDLYALGCVIFELLTGKRVFRAENPLQTMWMHVEDPPPIPSSLRPEIPPALSELVLWALQKKPEERPPSAAVMRESVALIRASLLPGIGAVIPSASSGLLTMPPSLASPPSGRAQVLVGTPSPAKWQALKTPSLKGGSTSRSGRRPPEARMLPATSMVGQRPASSREATNLGFPRLAAEQNDQARAQQRQASLQHKVALEPTRKSRVVPLVVGSAVAVLGLGAWFLSRQKTSEPDANPVATVTTTGQAPTQPIVVKPEEIKTTALEMVDAGTPTPSTEAAWDAGLPAIKVVTGAKPLTAEALQGRLKKLEAKLAALEQKPGEPDKIRRQFMNEARRTVAEADTESKRRDASRLLDEVAAQIK